LNDEQKHGDFLENNYQFLALGTDGGEGRDGTFGGILVF